MQYPVLLATVLLEPNRWKFTLPPAAKISEWTQVASEVGFAGLELWEDHYLRASLKEKAALRTSPCPVRIWNTYLVPSERNTERWSEILEAIHAFSGTLEAIKFNCRNESLPEVIDSALRWAEELPPHLRLLCECHGGTTLENPRAAGEAFKQWPSRFQAILHPLSSSIDQIEDCFQHYGSRITHLHLQMKREGTWIAPHTAPHFVRERLLMMLRHGFRGALALEFTEGTGKEISPSTFVANAFRDFSCLADIGFAQRSSAANYLGT